MKKSSFTSSPFFLILLFFSFFFSFSQQKVEQYNNNGLSTTIFNTREGKITVYLPFHSPGSRSSGTVVIEATGNSEKRKKKNEENLRSYTLAYGSAKVELKGQNIMVFTAGTNNYLVLLDENGREVSRSHIAKDSAESRGGSEVFIPGYMISGEPTKINASCDGNLGNNSLNINNSPVEILAESENAAYFMAPDGQGESEVIFNNNGEITRSQCHILDVALGVGKPSLMRGESTELFINISGFSGLDEQVPLQITNNSPSVVSLEGGNNQERFINPGTDAPGGTYSSTLGINSLQSGGFSLTVRVVPPQPDEFSSESEEILCNCYLIGQSQLISIWACEELRGQCSEPDLGESDLEDSTRPPDYRCDLPEEINLESGIHVFEVEDQRNDDIVAVSFSYRPHGEDQWNFIGTDNDDTDGFSVEWNPPIGEDGPAEVLTQVVNKNDVLINNTGLLSLNITPEAIYDNEMNISYTISDEAIRRAIDRARATGDRIREEQDRISELRRKYWDAYDSLVKNRDQKNSLIKIDEVLDKVPGTYKDSLKALVDSLSRLKKQLPVKIDTSALAKAVDDAQQRLDDCKKRLAELKKEQADLEKERDRLKGEIDDALEELDDLFTSNGWTGGYGYHSDGRPWYGYVGGENANVDIDDQKNALKRKIRDLKNPYLKTLRRLEQLPQEIADAEKECDELAEALEKAKEAKEKGDQHEAVQAEIEDKCKEIRKLLKPIWAWCVKNPGECDFKDKLRKLFEKCPENEEELEDFWDDFDDAVKSKKQKESEFEDAENDAQAEMDKVTNDIKNAEDNIDKLRDKQNQEYEEAARLRKLRAQQIEEERRRKREAAAAERERERSKAPKPEPILDEPIDPEDDQLKAQANSWVFKRLYTDLLINKGPCHCETKAVQFANNTNSIWSDIVGRIGVGVAFAPVEAFPGVGLAGKIGLGVAKALASHLFGGQDFSDELIKNLFNEIGGEIFPKLTGDSFTGSRLNSLAGKGLEEILKAEGVRVISWEGKVEICDEEVSGKTTMLINPNTGWVSIQIKIDDCPLVVIKYKVNKDGIPTNKPVIKTIRE